MKFIWDHIIHNQHINFTQPYNISNIFTNIYAHNIYPTSFSYYPSPPHPIKKTIISPSCGNTENRASLCPLSLSPTPPSCCTYHISTSSIHSFLVAPHSAACLCMSGYPYQNAHSTSHASTFREPQVLLNLVVFHLKLLAFCGSPLGSYWGS